MNNFLDLIKEHKTQFGATTLRKNAVNYLKGVEIISVLNRCADKINKHLQNEFTK